MGWPRAKWWICVKFPSHFNAKWTLCSATCSKYFTLASIIYFKLLSHYALDPLTLEIYIVYLYVCMRRTHINRPRTHLHTHIIIIYIYGICIYSNIPMELVCAFWNEILFMRTQMGTIQSHLICFGVFGVKEITLNCFYCFWSLCKGKFVG